MRLYTYVNTYLSPLQHGLQTAHVVSELFLKYQKSPKEAVSLWDWAQYHKTIIILNGNNSKNLWSLVDFCKKRTNPYPWTYFTEDEMSLDNAITCVGIIIPPVLYNADFSFDNPYLTTSGNTTDTYQPFTVNHGSFSHTVTKWEYDFVQMNSKYRLA